jgi:hypothetical protein
MTEAMIQTARFDGRGGTGAVGYWPQPAVGCHDAAGPGAG